MPTIDKITVSGTTYDIKDTTSGYMSTVSSPTADDVLTVDANGQATDSGVLLSTLTGKQNALTAGTGISIDASNNISVYYPNLINTDLDTVTYQFYGWVRSNCTNRPTDVGTAGGLLLCDRSSASTAYAVQIFMPYNSDTVYERRRNNSTTWSSWSRVNDSYIAGDTFTIATGSNDYVICTGYCVVSSSANNMRFFMPLSKPITASSIAVTQMYVYALVPSGGNSWVINNVNVVSSASQTAGYSLTVRKEENGIYFNLKCPSSVVLTNRDVATVLLYNTSISFS